MSVGHVGSNTYTYIYIYIYICHDSKFYMLPEHCSCKYKHKYYNNLIIMLTDK